MSIYYPKSVDFIKNRAKLLRKHFPELTSSAAQNATAIALGFKDWFDATKRIGSPGVKLGVPDEEISNDIRLQRRYQQSRALIDYTELPPNDLDEFVRRWSLTSGKLPSLDGFLSTYHGVLADLISDKPFDPENSRIDISEWKKPQMLVDGIIRAYGGGKHYYYYLSDYRFACMPPCLRGNFSNFLVDEDGHFVRLVFSSEFTKAEVLESQSYTYVHEPLIFEWLTGKIPTTESDEIPEGGTIIKMLHEAKLHPNDWFALSFRSDFTDVEHPVVYYPAITGSDFVKFIETKGDLLGLNLKWFKVKESKQLLPILGSSLRIDLSTVEESLPLYSSPFKMRPMSNLEYHYSAETGLLKLNEELDESWTDEYPDGLTVIESEDGSVISKSHIQLPSK